ncbi:MAG: hypothetical protein IKI69_02125 [Oscillospiraceae bacterium]|nr:hypothetical protein [Oscillospiraceae bacterium]
MKKLGLKQIIILIIVSVCMAMLGVVCARLLGYQGAGDNDTSWWSMLPTLFCSLF